MATRTHDLETHVGGFLCGSLLVDQAVMRVIEATNDDDQRVQAAIAALDAKGRCENKDYADANARNALGAGIRDGLLAS